MAWTFVNAGTIATASGLAGTTGQVADTPTDVADGDTLAIFTHRNDNVGTFDALSGWTLQAQNNEPNGEDRSLAIYTRIASSEPANYTVTHSDTGSEQWTTVMCAWRGGDGTTVEDVTYVEATHYDQFLNVNSPNAQVAKPITTASNGALVVIFEICTDELITSNADPSGYTNRVRAVGGAPSYFNRQIQVWDKEVATAGVETPGAAAWTASADTQETSYITIALKPAVATGIEILRRRING